jgi:diguanylate cyclase (GGDEF)-like protein
MSAGERAWALLTDWKTGVPNARAWEERGPLPCVVSIDVDNLKAMNDRWGHEAGDALLVAVCRSLERAGVVCYRIGGDEFTAQFDCQETAFSCLTLAATILGQLTFGWCDTQGARWTGCGAGFSFGVGTTERQAEERLLWVKQTRQEFGLRARRGRLSPLFRVKQVQTWEDWAEKVLR